MAEAALEKEKEEHRFNMKVAIDKLRESEIGRKIIDVIGEDELYKYDPNSINSLHIDAVIKHSREQKEKLKIQYKKVDYLIRAMHETEVPLLQKEAEEEIRKRREIQCAERELAIQKRERLVRMEDDKNAFLQSIRGQRHEDFVAQLKAFNERLNVERERRLEQLRKEHVEKKKQEWRNEKRLKQERRKREKEQRIVAERRRVDDERAAEARVADDERKRKFNEQAKKQREREDEVERKMQASKESTYSAAAPAGNVRRAPPGPSSSHQPEPDKLDKCVHLHVRSHSLYDPISNLIADRGDAIHATTKRINNHRSMSLLTLGEHETMSHGTDLFGIVVFAHRSLVFVVNVVQPTDVQMSSPAVSRNRVTCGVRNREAINQTEMIVGTIAVMIDVTTDATIDVMIAVMIVETTDADSIPNKHHPHRLRQRNDGWTEALKRPKTGAWSKRNVPLRTSENSRFNRIPSASSSSPSSARTGNDRPAQQRPEESSAGGAWRAKPRGQGEQREEPRDNRRSPAPPSGSDAWGRSDESSSWRAREKTRINRFVVV